MLLDNGLVQLHPSPLDNEHGNHESDDELDDEDDPAGQHVVRVGHNDFPDFRIGTDCNLRVLYIVKSFLCVLLLVLVFISSHFTSRDLCKLDKATVD